MIVEASPALPVSLPISATLFTAMGKRAAAVRLIDAHVAEMVTDPACPEGSIAILVRHGVRIFGTLHGGAGGSARFVFDDPLDDARRTRFVDARRCARPIIVRGRLAA